VDEGNASILCERLLWASLRCGLWVFISWKFGIISDNVENRVASSLVAFASLSKASYG